MKKLYILLSFIFIFLFVGSSKVFADENTSQGYISTITSETSVKEDIEALGLTYNDYLISDDAYEKLELFNDENGYSEQFVIAVGENYSATDNIIISYIYCYNPMFWYVDINVQLQITLNDGEKNSYHYNNVYKDMELIKQDEDAGIIVFTIDNLFKKTDLTRKYQIDINYSGMDTFECTYVTENDGSKRIDYLNYNSILYITKDVVVPLILKSEKNAFSGPIGELFTILSGKNPYDASILYFYNFSADKKIDKIISARFSYVEKYTQGIYSKLGWASSSPGEIVFDPVGLNSNTKVTRDIPNEVTPVKYYGEEINVNPYISPSSDRLTELSKLNISDEEKKLFTNYEHSILIAAETYIDNRKDGVGSVNLYEIDDVRLIKLQYETDGVIYSSIVGDGDGPETPTNPIVPEEPEKEWWEKFWDWFMENLPTSAIICVAVVILAPVLISLLISLITGSVSTVLGGLASILKKVLKLVFKFIGWLIKLPFTILKFIFGLFKK